MRAKRTSIAHSLIALAVITLIPHTSNSQTSTSAATPLPPNYKTIFENPDLLVMHVHYGAHEFVPMHDHPAVPTLYVYLNDAGEVDIIHEGPNAVTAHRPPTHTGAFRIAPGIAERHSVQSNSDTASDFLRVEFKHLTLADLPEAGKHVAANITPGIHTEFQNTSLRIDSILCTADNPCPIPPIPARSLLIAIHPLHLQTSTGNRSIETGEVIWLPANAKDPVNLTPAAQCLRVSLLYPE